MGMLVLIIHIGGMEIERLLAGMFVGRKGGLGGLTMGNLWVGRKEDEGVGWRSSALGLVVVVLDLDLVVVHHSAEDVEDVDQNDSDHLPDQQETDHIHSAIAMIDLTAKSHVGSE
jgi:riboflavin synthase